MRVRSMTKDSLTHSHCAHITRPPPPPEQVVEPAALQRIAITAARELADGTLKKPSRKVTLFERLLEGNPIGRSILFSRANAAVAAAAGGHYPAPPAIVAVVREGVDKGAAAGYAAEARTFGELGFTPASIALRGIFFAQTATRKSPAGPPAAPARHVTILGAGLMGSGIASVTVGAAKARVVLKDRDRASALRGEAAIASGLDSRVKRRSMTAFDRQETLARVVGVGDDDASWRAHVARSDVVIEAVFEDLALKHRVIREIEPLLRPDAVFASNTSALPLASIATAAARPERVLGMHYFSPVEKMPLLEIVPHAGTSPAALAVAFDLGVRQGKTVIVVKDVPGACVGRGGKMVLE